jgi:hypothetical protein
MARSTASAGESGSSGEYVLVSELHPDLLAGVWVAHRPGGEEPVYVRRLGAPAGDAPDLLEAAAVAGKVADQAVVLPLLGLEEVGGTLAAVSGYVEGQLLVSILQHASLRRQPMLVPVAVRIALDVLDGLAVVQGDSAYVAGGVRPETILVGTDGRTRVMEAGVAGVMATLRPWSRDPMWARYAAPEQIKGSGTAIASDVFSVAVVLWEMLRNVRLFSGATYAAVARNVAAGTIERVDAVPRPGGERLPRTLGDAVDQALQRERQQRFQAPRALAGALRAAGGEIAKPEEVAAYLDGLHAAALGARRSALAAAIGKSGAAAPKPPAREAPRPPRPGAGRPADAPARTPAPTPTPTPSSRRVMRGAVPPRPGRGALTVTPADAPAALRASVEPLERARSGDDVELGPRASDPDAVPAPVSSKPDVAGRVSQPIALQTPAPDGGELDWEKEPGAPKKIEPPVEAAAAEKANRPPEEPAEPPLAPLKPLQQTEPLPLTRPMEARPSPARPAPARPALDRPASARPASARAAASEPADESPRRWPWLLVAAAAIGGGVYLAREMGMIGGPQRPVPAAVPSPTTRATTTPPPAPEPPPEEPTAAVEPAVDEAPPTATASSSAPAPNVPRPGPPGGQFEFHEEPPTPDHEPPPPASPPPPAPPTPAPPPPAPPPKPKTFDPGGI